MNHIQVQKLLSKMPDIVRWIDSTLAAHATRARSVASFKFTRLPEFYSPAFLLAAKVIVVESVPVPPLSSLGLPELADFELRKYDGMTFKNTYFITEAAVSRESLHFHELVHVVQWNYLGVERFLSHYALGLAAQGYRNSPLEVMAYNLEDDFIANRQPVDVVPIVHTQLNELYS